MVLNKYRVERWLSSVASSSLIGVWPLSTASFVVLGSNCRFGRLFSNHSFEFCVLMDDLRGLASSCHLFLAHAVIRVFVGLLRSIFGSCLWTESGFAPPIIVFCDLIHKLLCWDLRLRSRLGLSVLKFGAQLLASAGCFSDNSWLIHIIIFKIAWYFDKFLYLTSCGSFDGLVFW